MDGEIGVHLRTQDSKLKTQDYADELRVRAIGQWAMVWRRFTRHKLALASAVVLLLLFGMAIVGQLVSVPPVRVRVPSLVTTPPLAPRLTPFDLGRLLGTGNPGVQTPVPGRIAADYDETPITSYILQGAWPMLEIGFAAAILAMLLGALVGGVAGYFGGLIDAFLMRVLDAIFTVPLLPLLIVLAPRLPDQSPANFILLLGLTGWPGIARLARSSVLSLREREFALAARALGGSAMHTVVRHMLPNALDVIIVAGTLSVAGFILAVANLTYLYVGPSVTTWADALTQGGTVLHVYWWILVFPLIPLFLTVLSVNFLGDGLRDAFDVTGRQELIRARVGREHRTRDTILRRAGAFAAAARRPLGAMRGSAARVAASIGAAAAPRASRLSARVPGARLRERARWVPAPPRALTLATAILLPVVLFVAGAGAFLYAHSPLLYSPHYNSAQALGTASYSMEYGAVSMRDGGWSLFFTGPDEHAVYLRTDRAGNQLRRVELGPADVDNFGEPSLGVSGRYALGAWLPPGNGRVDIAIIRPSSVSTFSIPPIGAGSQVDHPSVVAFPRGRFDVLFQTIDANGVSRIHLAGFTAAGTRPSFLRVLVHTHDYAFDPRGVMDGSGNLDVIYMSRFRAPSWHWIFRRYTPTGKRLSRPQVLNTVQYFDPSPPPTDAKMRLIPPQWAAEIKRAPDGSVWAAWGGNARGLVAHWSASGAVLLPPAVVAPLGWEGPNDLTNVERVIGLALTNHGGVLYHTASGPGGSYIGALPFNLNGLAAAPEPERIYYQPGGAASDPRGGRINGRPAVVWLRVGANSATIMASVSHPARPPDLLTRFGLNIGTLWTNVLFVLFGALVIGAGVAIANILIPAVLVGAWLLLSRLFRGRFPWSLYFLLLGAALLYLFARADLPAYVQIISGLGSPVSWVAVAGGILLTWWAGFLALRRQDAVIRATGMALAGVYFVAAMWAVIWIEGQIAQV